MKRLKIGIKNWYAALSYCIWYKTIMARNLEIEGYPRRLLGVIFRHPDVVGVFGVAVVMLSLFDSVSARQTAWELSQTHPLSGRIVADAIAALAGVAIMVLPAYIRSPKDLQQHSV